MIVTGKSRRGLEFGAAVLLSGLVAGCGGSNPKTALPQPPAMPTTTAAWSPDKTVQRVRDLEREAAAFADDSHKLPGQNAAEHAKLVQQLFTDLLHTFPLLSNPAEDRPLAQRMMVIDNARALLGAGGDTSIEPAIETGFRAAFAALADISHYDGFESAEVGPLLDHLSAILTRMERERDASVHRVDVSDAADQTSQIISKLSAAISGKVTAQPATGPSTAPISAPAAHP